MRRGIDETIKGKYQAKEVHRRSGAIFGGGTDQSMEKVVRVGMDEIVQRRGYYNKPPPTYLTYPNLPRRRRGAGGRISAPRWGLLQGITWMGETEAL